MSKKRKHMLVNIMAHEFTAVEFNLYLDTHPRDERALRAYNKTVDKLHELKKEYEEHYGPLTNFGYSNSDYPWRWVEEPWPWEINFAD
jgi:spore coat protein JB